MLWRTKVFLQKCAISLWINCARLDSSSKNLHFISSLVIWKAAWHGVGNPAFPCLLCGLEIIIVAKFVMTRTRHEESCENNYAQENIHTKESPKKEMIIRNLLYVERQMWGK